MDCTVRPRILRPPFFANIIIICHILIFNRIVTFNLHRLLARLPCFLVHTFDEGDCLSLSSVGYSFNVGPFLLLLLWSSGSLHLHQHRGILSVSSDEPKERRADDTKLRSSPSQRFHFLFFCAREIVLSVTFWATLSAQYSLVFLCVCGDDH